MRSFAVALIIFASGLIARAEYQVPPLSGPVVDEAGILNPRDADALDETIRRYHERGQGQLQVVIVNTLDGTPVEDATIKTFDAWKLGKKGLDNGILFFVAVRDKKMRIEVGRGFEGALPDVVAKRILSDQVAPLFRAGRYSEGIVLGVSEILQQVDGEFAATEPLGQREPQRPHGQFGIFTGLIILFILISIIRSLGGGGGGSRRNNIWWGGGGGGWGGGGFGGGGGWGGGSGGGWSGGGGSSAGGGASSDW